MEIDVGKVHPSMHEERKVITILASDLTGSTPLAFVQPWVKGWWEFGKSCSSLADLIAESKNGH